MSKGFMLFMTIFLATAACSQSISRHVIGSTGSLGSSAISSSSVGPSVLTTVNADSLSLTQGFQQPTTSVIFVEEIIVLPTCDDFSNGMIDLIISGCSGQYEVVWSNGVSEPMIEDLSPGSYTYTITSGSCSYTNSVELTLDENCTAQIPNVVTANGDGANDVLIIPNFYFELNQENLVSIFNRWGQEVWSGNNYDNQTVFWNGTDKNGNDLPAGTYYYALDQGENKLQGFIELLR